MAVSSAFCPSSFASVVASAGDRGSADSGARPRFEKPASASFLRGSRSPRFSGLSSALILRFPPNFVRQLSTKARRNCSNIGVAQIVAASWSNGSPSFDAPRSAFSADAVVVPEAEGENSNVVGDGGLGSSFVESQILAPGKPKVSPAAAKVAASFSSDGSLAVHAGERYGRGITTDGITTPIVNTSAYWFNNSDELIDFKEKRHASFEYGRYGNPTTQALEEKMSALEVAESTLFVSSGMYASVALFSALVPAGGHIVITTDCYRKTRIFIQNELPKMGISVTVIDPADVDSLKSALDQNNVSLFFSESPTNPFLRCVDIELVSQLCHNKGALVCIDSTFASPINQKALNLGADLVLHSATKFIAGHNDVLGGCISGSEELISQIRLYHHVIGGVLNPNAAYLILRGMKTLHLRVDNQNKTALRMAQFLEEHPKIIRVYYPGLLSHPEHHIAKRQMTGFGGVVSFEVAGDLETTKKFVDSLKVPYLAPSFGGCESIVDQPAIMSYWDISGPERVSKYGIKDNLVRFSFGIEGFEDLKADIHQALEKL
ncbi:cystathionine gamma-synthase 1, chloroplastic-like [Zingiber officinale]|uniref:cystathionine gamma-synthase 1, chloroplastic-like n=1 Tax=Zingiber officinale TaxID=94328 RepID=UPI001C4AD459|nr:cystathionine gamma-synthase 1, chloroplastic-like [Zingiber officinale]